MYFNELKELVDKIEGEFGYGANAIETENGVIVVEVDAPAFAYSDIEDIVADVVVLY